MMQNSPPLISQETFLHALEVGSVQHVKRDLRVACVSARRWHPAHERRWADVGKTQSNLEELKCLDEKREAYPN